MRSLCLAALVIFLSACPRPVGTDGEPGAQGPAGATGATGATGAQGPQGPTGEVILLDGGTIIGPRGPAGASVGAAVVAPGGLCATGGVRIVLEDGGTVAVLCNGTPGALGPQGPAGGQGPQGPAGGIGPQGPTGGAGVQGPTGSTGVQGPTGGTGTQGIQGIQGVAGLSVVSTPLSYGDATCQYGGTRLVVGTTTTYACNGAPGGVGPPGAPGTGDGGIASASAGEAYSFAGFTTAVYLGNLGGPVGAHAACNSQFPGAHLCTYREYQWTGSPTGVPAGGAWVDDYWYGSGYNTYPRDRDSSYTCSNWTVSTASYGNFVDVTGLYSFLATACQTARPLTCCRSNLAVFRGFTTAAYDGNLGGPVGAHAKCNAQFPGAHLCTYREYQWTGSPTAVPAGGAWVDDYWYGSGYNTFPRDRDSSYTCSNWTVNSASYGNFVDVTGLYNYTATACATPRPLSCCGR